MGEITTASKEQTTGIEQVNQAVAQMDTVTQQNAALVEEAAAATQSLDHQANSLVQAVSIFKLGTTHSSIGFSRASPALLNV
jgi:methyl-accepting chemotaxis protein